MEEDIGFRARYDFMTLLSRCWVPPDLHFCFRCNHLQSIDKKLRDEWYANEDGQEKIMPEDFSDSTGLQKGKWCHWKLRVGNKKRITAWCPKCVDGNLEAMPPRRPWPSKTPTQLATAGNSRDPQVNMTTS